MSLQMVLESRRLPSHTRTHEEVEGSKRLCGAMPVTMYVSKKVRYDAMGAGCQHNTPARGGQVCQDEEAWGWSSDRASLIKDWLQPLQQVLTFFEHLEMWKPTQTHSDSTLCINKEFYPSWNRSWWKKEETSEKFQLLRYNNLTVNQLSLKKSIINNDVSGVKLENP